MNPVSLLPHLVYGNQPALTLDTLACLQVQWTVQHLSILCVCVCVIYIVCLSITIICISERLV
jgi:hypothetical protein